MININTTSAPYSNMDLATVKLYLKIDYDNDDALLAAITTGCEEFAEKATGMTLSPKTYQMVIDKAYDAQSRIQLLYPPFISVDSVMVANKNIPYIFSNATGEVIINTSGINCLFAIKYQAGFESYSAIPTSIKNAILSHIAKVYENREGDFSPPSFAMSAYSQYRKVRL